MKLPPYLALPVMALAPAIAAAEPIPASPKEDSIPFAATEIHDWKADGDQGVYIQSITGKWYYARTASRCGRLRTAITLGFETRGTDALDKFGAINAEGWRCPLVSVTRSAGPPKAAKRKG